LPLQITKFLSHENICKSNTPFFCLARSIFFCGVFTNCRKGTACEPCGAGKTIAPGISGLTEDGLIAVTVIYGQMAIGWRVTGIIAVADGFGFPGIGYAGISNVGYLLNFLLRKTEFFFGGKSRRSDHKALFPIRLKLNKDILHK
jgi:hypothetical protein